MTPGGNSGKILKELSRTISDLLNQSVKSTGVISLFGDDSMDFSLLDEKFLKEVYAMKQKNLASELLKKLLADKIRDYKRTNVVKAKAFSEKMEEILNKWRNMQITNAEVMEQLLLLAGEIKKDILAGNELGLTEEEKAFYDALTKPQAIKDFYTNDQLVNLTKELTDALRKNWAIDMNKKEAARAQMRRLVKRLLKKYEYPPKDVDNAMTTILEQCELWSESMETA